MELRLPYLEKVSIKLGLFLLQQQLSWQQLLWTHHSFRAAAHTHLSSLCLFLCRCSLLCWSLSYWCSLLSIDDDVRHSNNRGDFACFFSPPPTTLCLVSVCLFVSKQDYWRSYRAVAIPSVDHGTNSSRCLVWSHGLRSSGSVLSYRNLV